MCGSEGAVSYAVPDDAAYWYKYLFLKKGLDKGCQVGAYYIDRL